MKYEGTELRLQAGVIGFSPEKFIKRLLELDAEAKGVQVSIEVSAAAEKKQPA